MKPSSWDKQLGLASPLERAARQSNQTDNPSKNVVGAGCQSPHPRPPEGRGEVYLLTSSFIGRVTRPVVDNQHGFTARCTIRLSRTKPTSQKTAWYSTCSLWTGQRCSKLPLINIDLGIRNQTYFVIGANRSLSKSGALALRTSTGNFGPS
jgi:hypothetical protein